jgi:hypothetical protein
MKQGFLFGGLSPPNKKVISLRPPRLSGEIYALTSPAPTEAIDFTDLYTISDNIRCLFFGLLRGRKNDVDKIFWKLIIAHHRTKIRTNIRQA